jgi:outer membrane protein assembly factor BamD
MSPSVLVRLALTLLLAAALGGCGGGVVDDETAGWSAQRLYGEAKDAMAAKDWANAVK